MKTANQGNRERRNEYKNFIEGSKCEARKTGGKEMRKTDTRSGRKENKLRKLISNSI